jgi:hypothetical protein
MIGRVRGIIFVLLLLAGIAAPGRAQDDDFVPPPPPEDRLLDESRVLARDEERRQAIVAALAELEAKHGFRIYYALYSSLYGRSLNERARQLQEAWLGDKPGLVLLLETDSRTYRFAMPVPRPREIEPGTKLEMPESSDLSLLDLSIVDRGLEGSLMTAGDSAEFAKRLGTGVATGVSAVFDQQATRPAGGNRSRMILLAIGLISVAGLVALLVVAGLKRAEARSLERYVFPKISVGMRLGAPYGGGKISSRSFGRGTKN